MHGFLYVFRPNLSRAQYLGGDRSKEGSLQRSGAHYWLFLQRERWLNNIDHKQIWNLLNC